jgi:hypothetical protein
MIAIAIPSTTKPVLLSIYIHYQMKICKEV